MRYLLPLLAIAALSAADTPTPASAATWTSVKAVLDTTCVSCHGEKKAKHNLRVDSIEALFRGGKKFGAAVLPGKPDESPLLKVLLMPRTEKLAMPPDGQGEPLTDAQITMIRQWITDGAKP